MASLRKELEKRELETLDLFTISFSLFRANFINFLIISLICCMPLILTGIYFPIKIFDPYQTKSVEELIKWFKYEAGIGFYINIFLSWFLDIISVLSISLLTERLIYGSKKTASWAIVKSFNFMLPTLFTVLIYYMLVFLGFTFFIIPGIALIILFVFCKNICVLRHTWGINALKYSFYLSKPKFFKTLFILGFIFLFQNVLSITFFPSSLNNREDLLSYFISMIILHIFDAYFKIIIALFFLNRDYVSNMKNTDEEKENGL